MRSIVILAASVNAADWVWNEHLQVGCKVHAAKREIIRRSDRAKWAVTDVQPLTISQSNRGESRCRMLGRSDKRAYRAATDDPWGDT